MIIENFRRRLVLTQLPKLTNHQIHTVTPAVWAKERAQLERAAISSAS